MAHSEYLWWLLALAPIALLFFYELFWSKRTIRKISSLPYQNLVVPQWSFTTKWVRFFFFSLMWIALIIGISNPQIGSKLVETKHEGIELILAVDVSNSMMAEDIRPSRLERTRMGIEKLIDRLQGDRLGIVIFAGKAFVQLPLTTDYAAAKLFTKSLSTNSITDQGTSIGAALEQCLESFDLTSPTSKAIIVVTDGEDHEENAIELAREAAELGIKIYTVGMGSENGAPIPIYRNGVQIGFRKDNSGNTVITKLNENMLKELADVGNGKFFRANKGSIGLQAIIDEINSLEKSEIDSKIYSDYEDRFVPFLILAALLLILEMIWPEMRLAMWDKFQLFRVKQ